MELKKIGVLSAAKIAGLFGVIYGLISAILLSIIYSKADVLASLGMQLPTTVTNLGYKTFIALPIINGVLYFIIGLIVAFIYNLLASWVGGVKLEFKEQQKKK